MKPQHEHSAPLDELSCSCGHCHGDEEVKIVTSGSSIKDFILVYGLQVGRILVSIIIFLLTLLISPKYPVNLIMFITSALVANFEIVIDFFKNFFTLKFFDENALMTIASVSAFILGEYFEGSLIVILFTLGEFLEKVATDNSRKKIAGLKDLKSYVCHLVGKDGIVDVSPEEVEIGSLIEVKKGERVPIDGILIGLTTEFDLKAVTGESRLYSVNSGGEVYSGAINVGESCIIKTSKKYSDSTASRIISLVEGSLSNKAKSQKFIKIFARYYTPIVVCLGFLIAFLPPLFEINTLNYWIYKALSFIVISCPCALVVSVPLAFFIGIGNLAKNGVLVKGSNHIDTLSKVDTVVFDKTGTLTEGNLSVENIEYIKEVDLDHLRKVIFITENSSSHPIAKALIKYFGKVKVSKEELLSAEIKEIGGRGLTCKIQDKTYSIGNSAFMGEFGIRVNDDYLGTVVYISEDEQLICKVYLIDKIKDNAILTIKRLRKIGAKNLVMLSGDNRLVVEDVKGKIGLNNAYYELLPDQKVDKLTEIIQESKNKVMFVGDGINDSPSITLSDVGVSMGSIGSEIAIETADVVVMDDDLSKIPLAITRSKKIKRKVFQNIIGSIAIKVSVMLLGLVINLPVSIAMFADVGVMLLAVGNSILLGKNK